MPQAMERGSVPPSEAISALMPEPLVPLGRVAPLADRCIAIQVVPDLLLAARSEGRVIGAAGDLGGVVRHHLDVRNAAPVGVLLWPFTGRQRHPGFVGAVKAADMCGGDWRAPATELSSLARGDRDR